MLGVFTQFVEPAADHLYLGRQTLPYFQKVEMEHRAVIKVLAALQASKDCLGNESIFPQKILSKGFKTIRRAETHQ